MTLYDIAIKTITQSNEIIEDWLNFKTKISENEKAVELFVNVPRDINKLNILNCWVDSIKMDIPKIKRHYKKQLPTEHRALIEVIEDLLDMASTAINAQTLKEKGDDTECKS